MSSRSFSAPRAWPTVSTLGPSRSPVRRRPIRRLPFRWCFRSAGVR
jgi:hypothetical protein